MAGEATQREEAIVRNEIRFREHNERAKASNAATKWVNPPVPDWSCECGWANCTQPVRLSVEEYEAVRAVPTRFIVAPDDGHVAPEAERVVERHHGYWVVEKNGPAAVLTRELDSRTDGAPSA